MSRQIVVFIALVSLGLLGFSHYSVYHWGVATESARHATAGVEVAQDVQTKTRVLQGENDAVAADYHQTQLDLERKNHGLQEEFKELLAARSAVVAGCDCDSADASDLGRRLQLINEAGDCPGLPDADGEPYVIDAADGLTAFTIEIATRYCAVAEQLNSRIRVK